VIYRARSPSLPVDQAPAPQNHIDRVMPAHPDGSKAWFAGTSNKPRDLLAHASE